MSDTTSDPDIPREVSVFPDGDALAAHIGERLAGRLVAAQGARGTASAVLTGGGIGTAALRALAAAAPADGPLDWSRVELWWGDERFVAPGDGDRNDVGADDALLAAVPLDPALVHRMGDSDAFADPDDAAAAYEGLLSAAAGSGHGPGAVPVFDVVLLGIGPEGHVASIFPGSPAASEQQRPVVAVRDCPKPPPTRISLTFPALCSAREVWIIASKAEKADAIARALAGADPMDVPAAGVHGRERTLFLLDEAAAAEWDGPRS